MANYYKRLNIKADANTDDIKKAFRDMAFKYHPDYGGDNRSMRKLTKIYKTLLDPQKRKIYDEQIVESEVHLETPKSYGPPGRSDNPRIRVLVEALRDTQDLMVEIMNENPEAFHEAEQTYWQIAQIIQFIWRH